MRLSSLGLSYDNRKPVSEVAKSVLVVNADKKMTADAAEALRKELADNRVELSKTTPRPPKRSLPTAKRKFSCRSRRER
ncbi:hypothetical protein LJK87_45775 [Paenibacillus sp. P25]|nr:hypothetical protein LJK87_45775 [Paenibacillus sp. P25]